MIQTADTNTDSGSNLDQDIIQTDRETVWHHLTQHTQFETSDPMVIVRGEGMRVTDARGREFLDATSGGVWSVNVGYGRTEIADAVREQLVEMCYFANTAGSIPGAKFAAKLLEKLPQMGRVYYSNSGSEANEKAYKMVRQLAHMEGDGRKHKIIYRDRDYHGTTIGALSSTGQFERKEQYGPFAPGFVSFKHCCCYRCPFGKSYGNCDIECARDLETVIQQEGPDTVGAVVLEPITAGGGVIPPVPEYFPIIQQICRKYDVLLHIDEVVCGLGRTGEWFGHQHYDVAPDIVTMAKGVASGYAAISCTVTTESLFERFKAQPQERLGYFRDISTFAGCTAGPAAGLVNVEIIEREKLLHNVRERGAQLMRGLEWLKQEHELVGDVRGVGLFAGLELVSDRDRRTPVAEQLAAAVAAHCAEAGVLIGRTNRSFKEFNNTLCLSPALIATAADIDGILHALDQSLARASNKQAAIA
ncbi:aminotransferase class III-fold pyridoxal phosphate-dependent enzyme [Microbulbifer bruguierae]|uniref:Aminotransferase class III-fold pyridoxal phosphate-dependent enzyme n=1 Tax=Microbulbifer bruguierae TaxID=3029061 RepID=A0ABY8NAG4_9GAMM|nr:aminotransferase class III-fold pyridoxal phosphate-dependent enzyme [Microbulbifer bruguierae]WGL15793.1 aminotransferase class III-fold pyridoxal phosphate-dependent enzyme [Microbulbifer bruguierae]